MQIFFGKFLKWVQGGSSTATSLRWLRLLIISDGDKTCKERQAPPQGGGGGACAVARWREGASSLLMESSGKQVIESAYVVVGSWTAVPWPHRLLVVILRIICRTTATAASFFTFVHQLARSRLVMCFVDIQCWIQISWSHSNGLWMVSG